MGWGLGIPGRPRPGPGNFPSCGLGGFYGPTPMVPCKLTLQGSSRFDQGVYVREPNMKVLHRSQSADGQQAQPLSDFGGVRFQFEEGRPQTIRSPILGGRVPFAVLRSVFGPSREGCYEAKKFGGARSASTERLLKIPKPETLSTLPPPPPPQHPPPPKKKKKRKQRPATPPRPVTNVIAVCRGVPGEKESDQPKIIGQDLLFFAKNLD